MDRSCSSDVVVCWKEHQHHSIRHVQGQGPVRACLRLMQDMQDPFTWPVMAVSWQSQSKPVLSLHPQVCAMSDMNAMIPQEGFALAMRQTLEETMASVVAEWQLLLKQTVEESLREALPEELHKAISPVLATLRQELQTQTPTVSPTGPTGAMVPSPGGTTPKMRRKLSRRLSNLDSLSADVTNLGRRSSLLLPPKNAEMAEPKRTRLPRARTDSMENWGADSETMPVGPLQVPTTAESKEEPANDLLLPPPKSPRSASPRSGRSENESCDAEAVVPLQSIAIFPEARAGTKPQPVPVWRKALRLVLERLEHLSAGKPPPQTDQVRILLKNPKHGAAVEIPGRPGRRSAVVLFESEVERLLERDRHICERLWPFSNPSGRPRQYWEIFACALHLMQLLYLCFQISFITTSDYENQNYMELKLALLVVDFFWIMDLMLTFSTGYQDDMRVLHSHACSNPRRYLQPHGSKCWTSFCDFEASTLNSTCFKVIEV